MLHVLPIIDNEVNEIVNKNLNSQKKVKFSQFVEIINPGIMFIYA